MGVSFGVSRRVPRIGDGAAYSEREFAERRQESSAGEATRDPGCSWRVTRGLPVRTRGPRTPSDAGLARCLAEVLSGLLAGSNGLWSVSPAGGELGLKLGRTTWQLSARGFAADVMSRRLVCAV